MEFEKSIFRTHYKVLTTDFVKTAISHCIYFFAFLSCLSILILILAHYYYFGVCLVFSDELNEQVKKSFIGLDGSNEIFSGVDAIQEDDFIDIVITFTKEQASNFQKKYAINKRKGDNLYMNISRMNLRHYKDYSYSSTHAILELPLNSRMRKNVTHYAVFLPLDGIALGRLGQNWFEWFVDIDTTITNLIIKTFKDRDGHLKEIGSGQCWEWTKENYKEFRGKSWSTSMGFLKLVSIIVQKAGNIIFAFFAFGVVSIVCSVMVRVSLIASAVFFLIIEKFTNCCYSVNLPRRVLYRTFPWIGVHAAYFARTGESNTAYVVSITLIVLMVCLFYGFSYVIWCKFCFSFGQYTVDALDSYFLYNESFEIFIVFFARTRITIKYFPKIMTALNVWYITYYLSYFYPFSKEALFVLVCLTTVTFLMFLKFSECPALEWNPYGLLTPTLDNPRQAYIRVLQSNFSINSDLWTLFLPPSFRSEFSREEQLCILNNNEDNLLDFSTGEQDVFDAQILEPQDDANEIHRRLT